MCAYRDIYTAQMSPFTLEFGHVMDNPFGWEERYEKQDRKNHRHQGKVNIIKMFCIEINL